MGRGHLTALDVSVSAKELNAIVSGCRINNIYDLGPRTYLFKFARPNKKSFLLIESGVRYHITSFERETGPAPNAFAAKLRKHLKNRRVEGFRQLGIDRVLHMLVGSGPNASHVFIELFSGGNIVLCDGALTIQALLRTETTETGRVAMRERYPIEKAKSLPETPTIGRIQTVVSEITSTADGDEAAKKTPTMLQVALALRWPKSLVAHCLAEVNLAPSTPCVGQESMEALLPVLHAVSDMYSRVCESAGVYSPDEESAEESAASPTKSTQGGFLIRDSAGKAVEFTPLLLKEHEGKTAEKFSTFNEAMDMFFSTMESIKKVQQSVKAEHEVISKEERMRRNLLQRTNQLENQMDRNSYLAGLIEQNLEMVDNAIKAITAEIARGVNWNDLQRLIEDERKRHNPMAESIASLDLARNSMTMLLEDPSQDSAKKSVKVAIDLGLSAYANAGVYYGKKKKAQLKFDKTQAASGAALQSASKRGQKDLAKLNRKSGRGGLSVRRQVLWFEKFHWFITSQGYLVIGGRDAQQNDLVVRRHLRPNDLYFHADIHGASSLVLKNPTGNEVPARSLEEAACMALCRSAAWASKAIISVYWVYSDQVSKVVPTGQYISTGSFVIRGKKNFVHPSTQAMGLGILFRLEDSCIAAHADERLVAFTGDDDDEDSDDDTRQDAVKRSPEKPRHGAGVVLNKVSDATPQQTRPTSNMLNAAAGPAPYSPNFEAERSNEEEDFGIDVTSQLVVSPAVEENGDLTIEQKEDSGVNLRLFQQSRPGDSDENDLTRNFSEPAKRSEPRLSRRQRRNLKKTGDPNVAPERPEQDDADAASNGAEADAASESPSILELPRGKRSKVKRMLRKYADQDEEERQVRVQLLGTTLPEGLDGSGAAAAEEGPVDDDDDDKENSEVGMANEASAVESEWVEKRCFHCHQAGHVVRECPELQGVEKSNLNRAIQAGQDQRRQEEAGEKASKGVAEIDDELSDLPALTGRPFPDDVLLHALPMCAPFSALSKFHLKVKLTPGSTKRGQAAKTAMASFMKASNDFARVKDLLRALPDVELTSVLMGDVKVSCPGVLDKPKSKGKKSSKPVKRNKGSKKR